MDDHRFDRLALAFGGAVSRRTAVAAVLTVLGLGAAGTPAAAGATRCREGRQTCTRNSHCCSETCDTSRLTALRDRHRCACREEETVCANRCVDLATDERHCGACGQRCHTGATCCGGTCTHLREDVQHCGACNVACHTGETCCGGACSDLRDDARHCGACNVFCHIDETCVSGVCVHDHPPI